MPFSIPVPIMISLKVRSSNHAEQSACCTSPLELLNTREPWPQGTQEARTNRASYRSVSGFCVIDKIVSDWLADRARISIHHWWHRHVFNHALSIASGGKSFGSAN